MDGSEVVKWRWGVKIEFKVASRRCPGSILRVKIVMWLLGRSKFP